MDLERLILEKAGLPETGIITDIVSITAVQTSGVSISLRDARPIGIAIGIAVKIIGGVGTVATSSTATGSSTTPDSIRTIMGIRTTTTRTITIRMSTIPAFMKAAAPITTARAPTIRR